MLSRADNELLTRTGPDTPMGVLLRRFWLPALFSSELPAPDCPPVRVRLLGENLVAFRDTDGRVGILEELCPHRGASMYFGRNEECGLRCVYHGWKFDVDGNCVDMPNEPAESNFKNKVHLTSYPVRERAGAIWIYMGPKELVTGPPELEWARVPESHVVISKYIGECNYMQALEGDIDSAHVSFLHRQLADFQSAPTTNGSRAWNARFTPIDRTPRFTVKDTDYGLMIGARRNTGEAGYYWRISQWLMPVFDMIGHDPGVPFSGHALVPMDDEHVWFWAVRWLGDRPFANDEERARWGGGEGNGRAVVIPGTWRTKANQDNDYLIDRQAQRTRTYTGISGIGEQDLAMTESMGPIFDRTREHLGTTDAAIIATRRRLLQAARDLQKGIEPYPAQHPEVYRIRPTAAVLQRAAAFDQDEGVRGAMIARG